MGVAGSAPRDGAGIGQRAWLVPLSIALSLGLGLLASTLAVWHTDPSGIVQSPFTTPLEQQLDSYEVVVTFGTPYAALIAAVASYVGLPRHRPWIYAAVGTAAGTGTMFLTGWEAIPIGNWWLDRVPSDPTTAAVYLGTFLVPPGVIAILLASTSARVPDVRARAGPLVRLLWLGVVVGMPLGALVGGEAASVAWGTAGPDSFLVTHNSLTNEMFGATLLAATEGAALGSVCGFVVWLIRLREPPDASPP